MTGTNGSPLGRLAGMLRRRKLDALLVTQPENRRYLSGFKAHDHGIAEPAGVLLVFASRRAPMLLTDFRYQLDAEAQAPGSEVVVNQGGWLKGVAKLLPALGIGALAFESHYMLHASAVTLARLSEKAGLRLAPVTGLVERARESKRLDEIEKISRSVALSEAVFKDVFQTLQAGQTERDVALMIERAMHAKGADGPSFETIVAGGPNGASPHAVPTTRPLRQGEPIVIDMGVRLDGYCSDMTRTVVLGSPDARTVELFRLVRKAQLAGLAAIKAGIEARAVDRAARRIIVEAGLGERFGHGLGHGVGLAVHEAPSLNSRSRKRLHPNMVVTVEPGIYLPGWGGIRLENMVVVGGEGCRLLNRDTTFLDL